MHISQAIQAHEGSVKRMSRYDKVNPINGSFRAKLAAAWTATSGPSSATDLNRILVVGINSSGQIAKAATVAACSGILIVHDVAAAAGDVHDVMTSGEVVEIGAADMQSGVAPTPGQKLYFDATAARLTSTAPGAGVNGFYVGQVIETGRLVVRCQAVQL